MRGHAGGAAGDIPEAPGLSEAMAAMVQSVWAAAWKRAAEQADESTAVTLDAAQIEEADALGAAEKGSAVTAGDRVTDEELRREVGQPRAQLDTAHRELGQARAQVEQADRARVRAEASSDTLREVLDTLRADRRGSATAKQ